MRGRLSLATVSCLFCMAGIGLSFWWFDWRASRPTPRPAQTTALDRGATVTLPAPLAAFATAGAPVLVHFYNPDCPCSRFNREHLRALYSRFGSTVRFVLVAESDAADLESPLGNDAPVIRDGDGALAEALGTWSTPQAVLLDGARRVVYAGNYNTSRFCANRRTEFVRLALESLETVGAALPTLPPWGCQLPAHLAQAQGRP
jgi:hypothetical protein